MGQVLPLWLSGTLDPELETLWRDTARKTGRPGDISSAVASSVPPSRSPRIGRGEPVAQVRGVVAERVIVSTELDPLMDLKALAAYSNLSKRTLENFIALPPDDALPCYRLGKTLVRRSHFDAWIERYRSRGRPSLARAIRELGFGGA